MGNEFAHIMQALGNSAYYSIPLLSSWVAPLLRIIVISDLICSP